MQAYVANASSHTETNVKIERAGILVLASSVGGKWTIEFAGTAWYGLRINEAPGSQLLEFGSRVADRSRDVEIRFSFARAADPRVGVCGTRSPSLF